MFDRLKDKLKRFRDRIAVEVVPTPKIEAEKPVEEKEKVSVIEKVKRKMIEKELKEKDLEPILHDFELSLLENDVALECAEKICNDLKAKLVGKKVSRKRAGQIIENALKDSISNILEQEQIDLVKLIKEKKEKPFVIVFLGFNGTGKTTAIAKIAYYLQKNGLEPVLAAGDCYRAAGIEQIEEHANNLGLKLVKHKRGADSAAVIYDAIEHAKAKNKPVVLADTAGRSYTNINLMDELEKICRVNRPDLKIFVGDSLAGNDLPEQARSFENAVGVDTIILTKVDCDAKGGGALSIAYGLKKPILFLGTGQGYEDLQEFEPEWFLEKIF